MDDNLRLDVLVERYHNPSNPPCHRVFTREHSIEGISEFFDSNPYATTIVQGTDTYWSRWKFVLDHNKAKTSEQKKLYERTLARRAEEMEKVGEGRIWIDFPNYAQSLPETFGLDNIDGRSAKENPLRNA